MNDTKKQKMRKSGKNSLLKKIIIVLTCLVIAVSVIYTVISTVHTTENAENKKDNSDNQNIILSVTDSQILGGFSLTDGNVVMTTNSFISFKSDGTVRTADKLGYSKSAVKQSGNKYIVFERTTGNFALLNRSGIIYYKNGEDEIINADIAKNGSYAIITRKSQASALLSVYSSSNELLFSWECVDEYLNHVALSDNGKTVVVSTLGVDNGEGYSKLIYFNINSTDIEGEIKYPGENIYSVKFTDKKEVGVVTDLNYMLVDLKELKSKIISNDYDEVSGYFFSSKSSVAILKNKFGTLDANVITVIDKNGEILFDKEMSGSITDFKTDKKYLYVMKSGEVEIYSLSSGEILTTITTDSGLKSMFVNDNAVYCLSEADVYRYEF